MGICRKERTGRGKNFQKQRGWRSSRRGAPRRPLWAFHLQTLVCLDCGGSLAQMQARISRAPDQSPNFPASFLSRRNG